MAARNRARLLLAMARPEKAVEALEPEAPEAARALRAWLSPELLDACRCRVNLHQLGRAIGEYRRLHGVYPGSLEDLVGEELMVLPTCPTARRGYFYRRSSSERFTLRCPGDRVHLRAGYARRHPRWDPSLGPIGHPAERPPFAFVTPSWAPTGPLEASVSSAPFDDSARVWLSCVRDLVGDREGAIRTLRKASGTAAMLHRTLLAAGMGHTKEALAALRDAARLGPLRVDGEHDSRLLEERLDRALAAVAGWEAGERTSFCSRLFGVLAASDRPGWISRLLALRGRGTLELAIRGREAACSGPCDLGEPLPDAEDLALRGVELAYDGRRAAAAFCLEWSLAQASPPLRGQQLLLLARIYREEGMEEAAASALRAAKELRLPAIPEALEEIRQRYAFGDRERAWEELRSLALLVPKHRAVTLEALHWQVLAGRTDEGALETLRALDGPLPSLLEARTLASLGRTQQAIGAYSWLAAQHPGWAAVWEEAAAFRAVDDPEGALRWVERALEQRPGHVRLLARRVAILRACGRSDEKALRALYEVRPDQPDPHAILAEPLPLDGPAPMHLITPDPREPAEQG